MPSVALGHAELVSAVQQAMAAQLVRDGRLRRDAELGLVFFAQSEDDLSVLGTVRSSGQTLCELKGTRPQLCAIATELALSKLTPEVRRTLQSSAQVRWRTIRFTCDEETIDRFMADVEFLQKA